MANIKIGDAFKNMKGDIHVVTKISKTALIIHARNTETNVIEKFRFYDASGEYLIQNRVNTELGYLLT